MTRISPGKLNLLRIHFPGRCWNLYTHTVRGTPPSSRRKERKNAADHINVIFNVYAEKKADECFAYIYGFVTFTLHTRIRTIESAHNVDWTNNVRLITIVCWRVLFSNSIKIVHPPLFTICVINTSQRIDSQPKFHPAQARLGKNLRSNNVHNHRHSGEYLSRHCCVHQSLKAVCVTVSVLISHS